MPLSVRPSVRMCGVLNIPFTFFSSFRKKREKGKYSSRQGKTWQPEYIFTNPNLLNNDHLSEKKVTISDNFTLEKHFNKF